MDKHVKIFKNRRRLVLADSTGHVNAFFLSEEEVSFKEGDTIPINNFKFQDGSITLQENSDMIRYNLSAINMLWDMYLYM